METEYKHQFCHQQCQEDCQTDDSPQALALHEYGDSHRYEAKSDHTRIREEESISQRVAAISDSLRRNTRVRVHQETEERCEKAPYQYEDGRTTSVEFRSEERRVGEEC